jgi:hypothetical protein
MADALRSGRSGRNAHVGSNPTFGTFFFGVELETGTSGNQNDPVQVAGRFSGAHVESSKNAPRL